MPKRYSMLSISMIRNLFGDRLSRPEIYRCSGGFYQTGKFIGIDFYDPEYIGADFHDPEFIGVDFQRMSEFIGIQWKFNRYLSISLFSTRGTRAKRGNLISLRFIDNTFFNAQRIDIDLYDYAFVIFLFRRFWNLPLSIRVTKSTAFLKNDSFYLEVFEYRCIPILCCFRRPTIDLIPISTMQKLLTFVAEKFRETQRWISQIILYRYVIL